ncbi:uncharacterized protein KIAA1143 homolog isoform X3 [Brienomyrus brachyistius]|uniref:uncharacterized protein KIAA1143 homolog isoform X1 n=1 Tax=Brienomyrus brachyistius TaxID=42636 RepID=UPI0020B18201|nr:uncharacterized protein KIAA1143 homolog isoform X1 [Brienomyrus brachyistius]XP_048882494.1 uncharacterized protein KIAA1143 homolog isoform X2 [Brienomyrus brachyistius]XP_048882495.1 uncharacterized protein KIAA1143 homolog isoform X3 [Brienomyrus brachyistius]
MSKKGNISWVKPTEPSFLRKFKNDVGYKEGPTIDTKKVVMPTCDDDSGDSDREDEMPQVVVLKDGHLNAEEVKNIKAKMKASKDAPEDKPPEDGKILFRKPVKRTSEKFQGITASSSKKKKSDDVKKEDDVRKKVKNSSLLSFGGDEEEDD